MIALPTPPGSGGSLASSSASFSMRSDSAAICSRIALRRPGRFDVMSARDRSSRSRRCGSISRWNRRTALSVQAWLYWFERRWWRIRKRTARRASRSNTSRCVTLSNMRAPTSAWPWKCTPSGVNVRVGTLPMSWSSAAQRTSGRRTDCFTTCLVWLQTSLCWRPVSCCRCTVASSSGNTCASSPVSRTHSRA